MPLERLAGIWRQAFCPAQFLTAFGYHVHKTRIMRSAVFRTGPFRFHFSREEVRMRVHIQGPDGEAGFWLEPGIELATSIGLRQHQLKSIQTGVEEYEDEIGNAWNKHFQS